MTEALYVQSFRIFRGGIPTGWLTVTTDRKAFQHSFYTIYPLITNDVEQDTEQHAPQ